MRITSRNSRNAIAWLVMLTIGTFWGGTIPLSKVAVSTGYQPFGLILWQLVIGVLVLGSGLLWRGWRQKPKQISANQLRQKLQANNSRIKFYNKQFKANTYVITSCFS